MQNIKIKSVEANNRRKCIIIHTSKDIMTLPYQKLLHPPSASNNIVEIFVDPEIKNEGITYRLKNGSEDTIHLDVFLNYNRDPSYLREIALYDLTVKLQKQKKRLKISTSEIARKLNTSRSQINRLLDQTNTHKSLDSMLELACVLGVELEIKLAA